MALGKVAVEPYFYFVLQVLDSPSTSRLAASGEKDPDLNEGLGSLYMEIGSAEQRKGLAFFESILPTHER